MEQQNPFSYTYSAPENQELLRIRDKYLPREESTLEELKRLDHLVESSGVAQALFMGIGGCLIFGLGLCFCLEVLGDALWFGITLGLIGAAIMLFAYPVYRKLFDKCKRQHTPRILELISQLADNEGVNSDERN